MGFPRLNQAAHNNRLSPLSRLRLLHRAAYCGYGPAPRWPGPRGRGASGSRPVGGPVDTRRANLGQALGGAAGGFTAGRQAIVDLLRQRSRPYLFSNTLAPAIVAAAIAGLDLLSQSTRLRDQLAENTTYFRAKMTAAGFDIRPGEHPIVAIMLGEAQLAQDFSAALLAEGIYVIGFFYPVVPQGTARIRVQISAIHTRDHLDRCVEAFVKVGKQMGVV